MLEILADPNIWLSLATLTLLEIVLGIDNLIFVAVVAERLPPHQRALARRIGLSLALLMRVGLLFSISWLVSLTAPVLHLWNLSLSWRDIILIGGGLFLLFKATMEIHEQLEGEEQHATEGKAVAATLGGTIVQIIMLDLVFSFDSVITAVGMSDQLVVMIAAVVLAMIVMLLAAAPLSGFVHAHPTILMLSLAFLIMIGTSLIADGLGFHIPKGYLYTAIAFSLGVEALNQMYRRRRQKRTAGRLAQTRDLGELSGS